MDEVSTGATSCPLAAAPPPTTSSSNSHRRGMSVGEEILGRLLALLLRHQHLVPIPGLLPRIQTLGVNSAPFLFALHRIEPLFSKSSPAGCCASIYTSELVSLLSTPSPQDTFPSLY